MLRKTHPLPVDAVPMLREKGLKKYAEVVTIVGDPIGVAMRFYHRSPDEVEPQLRLYRTYLEVQSIELGGTAYVPTVFISNYDPVANQVYLVATMEQIEEEGWNRKPDFIARGWGVPEELL